MRSNVADTTPSLSISAAPSIATRALRGLTRVLAMQGVSNATWSAPALDVQDAWSSLPGTAGRHLLADSQPFYNFRQGAGGGDAPTSNVPRPPVTTFDPIKPAPALPLLAGTAFGSLPPGFQVLPRNNLFDYTHLVQGRLNNCWLLSSMIATVQSGSLLTPAPIAATEEPGVFTASFYRSKVENGVSVEGQESIRVRNQLPFRGNQWDIDNNVWSGSPGYRLAWPGVWVKAWVAFNNRYPMPQAQQPQVRGMQILDTVQSTKTPLYMLTGKRPKQLNNGGTQAEFTAVARQAGSAKTALTLSCADMQAHIGGVGPADLGEGLKVVVYRNPLIGTGTGNNALAYGEGPLPAKSAVSLTCSHYYVLLGVNPTTGWFRFHNPVGKNQVWSNLANNQIDPDAAAYNPVLELPFEVVKNGFKTVIYT